MPSFDTLITIAGDMVELVDRRAVAEGLHPLSTETKDYLGEILVDELRLYLPEPKEVQNVLPFPGMPRTI